MSNQKLQSKEEQLLENSAQVVDNKNVPSELNTEFKNNDFSEEGHKRQEILKPETSLGPESCSGLKPGDLEPRPKPKDPEPEELRPEPEDMEQRPEPEELRPENTEQRPEPEELRPEDSGSGPELTNPKLSLESEPGAELTKLVSELQPEPGDLEPRLEPEDLRPEDSKSRPELKDPKRSLESEPKAELTKLVSELKPEDLDPRPVQKNPKQSSASELKNLVYELQPEQSPEPEEEEQKLEPEDLRPEEPKSRPELKNPKRSLESGPREKLTKLSELKPEDSKLRPELKNPKQSSESEPSAELKKLVYELKPEQGPELEDEEQRPENPEIKNLESEQSAEKRLVPELRKKNLVPELKEPKLSLQLEPILKSWTQGTVVVALIAVGVALCALQFHGTQTSDFKPPLEIFQDKFESLQKVFLGQRQDLWLRSGKMLRNHLNKSHPGEPATLILTAAQDARRTLLCLGSGLAQAYADSHNASWLEIHGPSEAIYDDSTAKFHIDEKLSSGFGSTHRAAVLNHLEALPPGSLLILYKYCDHENAAYKNVALVFTVLLEDSSLEPDTPLPELEEKVRDFLWQKFIISDTIRSHQEMDSDKLGGVWSRISHLVLPVLPVKSIEYGNCPFNHK